VVLCLAESALARHMNHSDLRSFERRDILGVTRKCMDTVDDSLWVAHTLLVQIRSTEDAVWTDTKLDASLCEEADVLHALEWHVNVRFIDSRHPHNSRFDLVNKVAKVFARLAGCPEVSISEGYTSHGFHPLLCSFAVGSLLCVPDISDPGCLVLD